MEGNDCYKFSTIKNFVERTNAAPISRIIDIGANVGDVLLEMNRYFPNASIVGLEPVPEYFQRARASTRHLPQINVVLAAVSYQHLFEDDLGHVPRPGRVPLRILQATADSGPGWIGGSMVLPADHAWVASQPQPAYELLSQDLWPLTLEEVLKARGWGKVDILKLDCEGSENSILGSSRALNDIRFIVGEYHGLERFYQVMKEKLFKTHKVNLVGDSDLGAFFAERLDGDRDGILKCNKDGMLKIRSWLSPEPLDWHLFDEQHVAPSERRVHGLPG
jgi:hypothetical protein